jgi:radical SAM protein
MTGTAGGGSEVGRGSGGAATDAPRRDPGRGGHADAPRVVAWEVTRACDLACRHCRADARPGRDAGELTTAEGKALLDRIVGFGDPSPVVVFTGGDPLKRPDLVELAEHGTRRGLRMAVTPATTPLLDRPALEALSDAGVRRVALSVDGAAAARHDAFRGEEGSFGVARRAAAHASELGLPVQINTTVCRDTVDDLPAVADLAEAWGAVMWEVFFLVPVGRGEVLDPLGPTQHETVLEWLYRRQKVADFRLITVEAPFYRRVGRQVEAAAKARRREEGRAAPAEDGEPVPVPRGSTGDGDGFLFVSHRGKIFPSGFLPVPAGDVRRDDVVEVYREAPLFRWLRDKDLLRGKCGACEYRWVCGGSRARAFATTGDWRAADPFCPYVPDGWYADSASGTGFGGPDAAPGTSGAGVGTGGTRDGLAVPLGATGRFLPMV